MVKINKLPEKQFAMMRDLAITISNNSCHSINSVVEAMELDLDFSDVVDTICRWSIIAATAKKKVPKPAPDVLL